MVPITAHPSSVPEAYKKHYTAYEENATDVPIINRDSLKTLFEAVDTDYNSDRVCK